MSPTVEAVLETYKLAGVPQSPASEPRKRKYSWGTGVGAGVAGYYGGSLASHAGVHLGGIAGTRMVDTPEVQLTAEQIERLRAHMGIDPKVEIHSVPDARTARYHAGGTVFSPADASMLAHELGHSRNFSQGGITRALFNARAPGMLAAGLSTLGASVASADEDTVSGRIGKWMPAVAAVGVAPTLIDEGLATHKALAGLKKLNLGAAAEATARRRLGLAYGSYLGLSGGLVAAPWVARQIKKKLALTKEQPKEAAADGAAAKRRRHAYYLRNRDRILAHGRMYRQQNSQDIKRKQTIYRRQVGQGVRKKKRRLSSGGHSYTFAGWS